MNRIKGHVCEVLSPDTLLVEIKFIGNFNRGGLPDFVKVRFTELSPPYLRDVPEEDVLAVLNRSVLGAYVSANLGRADPDGVFSGKVSLEGSYFRRKKRYLAPKKKKDSKEKAAEPGATDNPDDAQRI